MKYPEDFINKIICGGCLEVMKKMPKESIDMCMTSPPYWGLRDYGVEQFIGGNEGCEHPYLATHGGQYFSCGKCGAFKGQLGLEPTPELYIEHLTEIFNEVKRVLKKEGTLWLNIGDTYSGQKAGNTEIYKNPNVVTNSFVKPKIDLPTKCLCMIPERLAWLLIQNGWILRNKIAWIKENPMPESVKDRFSRKWEYVFYFVKSQRNYFDLDSVREPHITDAINKLRNKSIEPYNQSYSGGHFSKGARAEGHELGKNPGDIWIINTVPCPVKGIHFATFPEELCRKAIISGCPEDGIVLDPFAGIGTTGYVARKLGRKFIIIDIKKEYCEKAENKRLAQGVL